MGIFSVFFFRRFRRCCKKKDHESSFRREAVVNQGNQDHLKIYNRRMEKWMYDKNGREILYMRKLEDGEIKTAFPKVRFNPSFEEDEEEKRIDCTVEELTKSKRQEIELPDVPCSEKEEIPSPSPQPPAVALRKQMPESAPPAKKDRGTTGPPPPPPPPLTPTSAKKIPPAPPLPSPLIPLLPPIIVRKNSETQSPSPKKGSYMSVMRPLRPQRNNRSRAGTSTDGRSDTGFGRMKLKPLHWDKVMANADHSMVWDQIKDGSLRFDDDLIETLFGYSSSIRRSPQNNIFSGASGISDVAYTAQVFILSPRKSQNTAIVLKSLAVSRREIVDSLREGQGLSAETLEKLVKITPTKDEEAKILQFNGNPAKLADAESFLYHVLKALPSAFMRTNAMLFRLSYESEILNLKETLQTLELACKELRSRSIFLKLLEAILKAGNRMNAGTARGDAKGFNLNALRRLSDVKSTDGKTTLLHFVVEQAARSEGQRLAINQKFYSRDNGNPCSSDYLKTEEKEKEFLMLGLPALVALSNEFSNVNTAASIEYDSFISMCSNLTNRVAEIRQLVIHHDSGDDMTGFVREMKGFLEECDEELEVVKEEQIRIMELVERTTKYYQAETSREKGANLLHMFVIVKDFLDMVDRVRADITRKLQKKNAAHGGGLSPPKRSPLQATNFRFHFTSDMSRIPLSGEPDDDF